MQTVAVLAVDGTLNFELAVPGQVFGSANLTSGSPLYDVRICHAGTQGLVATARDFGGPAIAVVDGPETVAAADLVIVPGDELSGRLVTTRPDRTTLDAVNAAADRGARVASLCVGAFTLAAAGLLDGRRATTHWAYADELARRHPDVDVDPSALYVDDGQVLTSAGVTSSIDLCIHIVRTDHGDEVASATARHLVMSPHRLGGQAQFVQRDSLLAGNGDVADTLRWLEANLDRPISLTDIAGHAGTSRRSVTRHFHDQTGVPPLRWLLNARVERAKELLSATDLPIEEVARRSGFGTGTTFRHHFIRIAGVSPRLYRRTFNGRVAQRAPAGRP